MSVVRGSGVGVVLHSGSKVVVGGRGMLGSPTKLLDNGFSLVSLSESLSLGSVNHPLRLAVFVRSWVLRPKMEQGFGLVKLVLRLRGFQRKTGQSFKVVFVLRP